MQALTTARPPFRRTSPQVEHQGRLAALEAVHEAALVDARDGALAQNVADQNRLTKLAADHLRALHSADELNTALRSELAEVR
jgi:hypothetical protein